MRAKDRAVPAKARICARCDETITRKYPPVMLVMPEGTIIGPYHARCAQKYIEVIGGRVVLKGSFAAARVYGHLEAREETVPW